MYQFDGDGRRSFIDMKFDFLNDWRFSFVTVADGVGQKKDGRYTTFLLMLRGDEQMFMAKLMNFEDVRLS